MAPKVDQRYRVTSDPFAGAASPPVWAIEDIVGKVVQVVAVVPATLDGAGDKTSDCVVVQWQDGDASKPAETHGPMRISPSLRTASVPASDFADHFGDAR